MTERSQVAWDEVRGWGGRGDAEKGKRVSDKGSENIRGAMDMFMILIVMMFSQVHTHVKNSSSCHSNYVQFTICQLYLHEEM